MMRGRMIVAVLSWVLVAGTSGCERSSPAAPADPTSEVLATRIKALEDLLPSQSHMMADVGDHFTNLWFAGRAENWPLADFYLGETKQHLRWAVRRIQVRKDNQGREVKLGPILEAFENSQLTDLKKAIDGEDEAAFERVYRESL